VQLTRRSGRSSGFGGGPEGLPRSTRPRVPADVGGSRPGARSGQGCIPRHSSGAALDIDRNTRSDQLEPREPCSQGNARQLRSFARSADGTYVTRTGQHYPGKHISPKARAIYFLSLLFYVSTIFAELMPRPLARPSANPLREAWQPVYLMDITTS
jgi:hypothetical protein